MLGTFAHHRMMENKVVIKIFDYRSAFLSCDFKRNHTSVDVSLGRTKEYKCINFFIQKTILGLDHVLFDQQDSLLSGCQMRGSTIGQHYDLPQFIYVERGAICEPNKNVSGPSMDVEPTEPQRIGLCSHFADFLANKGFNFLHQFRELRNAFQHSGGDYNCRIPLLSFLHLVRFMGDSDCSKEGCTCKDRTCPGCKITDLVFVCCVGEMRKGHGYACERSGTAQKQKCDFNPIKFSFHHSPNFLGAILA